MHLWEHQVRGLRAIMGEVENGRKRMCVTAPCGAGKTVMMKELIEFYAGSGKKIALYTNRKLLTSQTSGVLESFDVKHGIRASGFDTDLMQQVQICSLLTEQSRVVKRQKWDLHKADIVIIDEAHAQKAGVAINIFNRHLDAGGALIGFTATPISVGHLYEILIPAGTHAELLACGAHVPCTTFGPDEPDLRHVRRSRTGEFVRGDVVKAINRQVLFGRVVQWWRTVNPHQRPTILFAPGVSESKWFVDQFEGVGVSAAHIDGKSVYWNGKTRETSVQLREELLDASRTGEIKVLCNRFVLREGIDAPWLYNAILATPFGSLTSYLQAGGRLLRAHRGLNEVILTDHGGSWWRHGAVDAQREWDLADDEFKITAKAAVKQEKDPLCCPKCGHIRAKGALCPICGCEMQFRWKTVIQEDGTLVKMRPQDYRAKAKKSQKTDAQKMWDKCYFSMLNGRSQGKVSMRRVAEWYEGRSGKSLSPDLIGVPRNVKEWGMSIAEFHACRGKGD